MQMIKPLLSKLKIVLLMIINRFKNNSIITTRKTGGLLHGYKLLRIASVSRRWLSLRSSQIAMISLPPLLSL